MARILVTGVNGFTGQYVAKELAAQGHTVIGLAREDRNDRQVDGITRRVADLADISTLQKIIADTAPDRVVHLAAISFVSHSNVDEIYQANLIGTINLLNALVSHGKQVERVLLASSANIYGNQQAGRLDEHTTPLPSNHYGISKLALEHVARLMGEQLPIIISRPFNYTGVGQAPNFVIPKIVDHARQGKLDLELGNINVARDFSDVRTVARIYAQLLDSPDAIGKTFNVCSGRSYTLRDVISTVESLAGISFNITVNPAFVRRDEIMELFGNPGVLESVIGPVDMPPLRDTLAWMLEH